MAHPGAYSWFFKPPRPNCRPCISNGPAAAHSTHGRRHSIRLRHLWASINNPAQRYRRRQEINTPQQDNRWRHTPKKWPRHGIERVNPDDSNTVARCRKHGSPNIKTGNSIQKKAAGVCHLHRSRAIWFVLVNSSGNAVTCSAYIGNPEDRLRPF